MNHPRRFQYLAMRIRLLVCLLAVAFAAAAAVPARADEPYARSKTYDLQHSRIALSFNTAKKEVIGDVTHTLALLRDNISKISFDSVDLNIRSVTVNKVPAKFATSDDKLTVDLAAPGHVGEKYDVEIKYDGQPSRGLYFILPNKDYPHRPIQIWSQGESEDTRAYIPTYDYPNDRLTTETILTVPSSWITISNGKLMSVTATGKGLKTWTWKESLPSSTYLITVVAGEFDEVKDSWRTIPVTYYAPKGRGDRLSINYGRTPQMIELFSKKFGFDYPWEKYSQAMVDDFVAGGMENSSATTNTSASLRNPRLAPEYLTGEDDLISHELGHQWFGDTVTCKDWAHIWLNEGFATFAETVWTEAHYGKDQADYTRWLNARDWFDSGELYDEPIVRFDFNDSSEFNQNVYNKGGWVLYMLRHKLGDEAFYAGLKHYLDVNHGKNVVTSDFAKAMEEATHTDIDRFLNQWVYGAGAPRFELSYTYDAANRQVALLVRQTQKIEPPVGLFRVPVDVQISTASGAKDFPITVSKREETFTFPADSAPLMVLFDKGGQILKSADFHKDKKEWIYQLAHATEVADRADAAVALGKLKTDEEAIAALGIALDNDKAWGVRATAADALGKMNGDSAEKLLLAALPSAEEPWLRARIVGALGFIKGDAALAAKLENISREDKSFRARGAALTALGHGKSSVAYSALTAAVSSESPDGFLRRAALRALGTLGDDRAAPLLLDWSAPGKDFESRIAAIYALANLQKDNHEITKQLASYTGEPHYPIRIAAIRSLGTRGDDTAIPALQALLKSGSLSILMGPTIKAQIARLQRNGAGQGGNGAAEEAQPAASARAVDQRLDRIEHLMQEMNGRLKAIESRLPAKN